MESLSLNYNVPFKITEAKGDNPSFLIEGVAINATTTSNNHKFLSEELESSANTLTGVPLLKDHQNSVDAIVGRVQEGRFNQNTQNILFKAQVVDSKMKELIKQGVLNSVSVGADAMDIQEEEGTLVPRGIIFRELSLVAVPADSGATFGQALKEAYDKHYVKQEDKVTESKSGDNIIKVKGGLNMEENYATKDELLKLQEMIEAQTKLISELLSKVSVKEADEDEQKVETKEEKSEEPKSEVKEEVEEVKEETEEVKPEKSEEAESEESEEVEESTKYLVIQESSSLGGISFSAKRK
jgi:hypothetical protein